MKGKKLAIAAVCILAFGGIVANTCVFAVNENRLQTQLNEEKAAREKQDETLNKLILDTKAELQQNLDNAVAEINQSILGTKTDLTEIINGVETRYKAADEKLAAELIATIEETDLVNREDTEKLVQDTAVALATAVDNALEGLVAQFNQVKNSLVNYVDTYYVAKEDFVSIMEEVYYYLDYVMNAVNTVNASLNAKINSTKAELEGSIAAVKNDVVKVTANVNEVKTRVDQLQADLEQLKQDFEDLKKVKGDVDNVLKEIEKTNATVADIKKAMEEFNGKDAVETKAACVSKLAQEYALYPTFVEAKFTAAITELGIDEADPLYAELRESADNALSYFVDKAGSVNVPGRIWYNVYEPYKTRIDLAATAKDAEAAYAEGSARISMYTYPFQLDVLKALETAKLNKLGNLSTEDKGKFINAYSSLTYSIEQFEQCKTAEEIEALKKDKTDRMSLVYSAASKYDQIVTAMNEAKATIDALTNLTAEQKAHFAGLIDTLASVDGYLATMNLIPLDKTTTTEADVEKYIVLIKDKIDYIVACAKSYDDIVSYVVLAKSSVNQFLPGNNFPEENEYYMDQLDEIMSFDTYKSAIDRLDQETLPGYVKLVKLLADYNVKSATTYSAIANKMKESVAKIDTLANLTTEENTVVKDAISDVLDFDTYKSDVSEFMSDFSAFDAYMAEKIGEIDLLVLKGETQDKMRGQLNSAFTAIEAEATLSAKDKSIFENVLNLSFVEYGIIGELDGEYVIIDCDKDEVLARAANFEKDIAVVNECVEIYVKTVLPTSKTVDEKINSYKSNWKALFAANCNNDRKDELKVLEDYAETIDALIESLRFKVALTDNSNMDYEKAMATLLDDISRVSDTEAIKASFDNVVKALGAHEIGKPATGLYAEMEEYYYEEYENPYIDELQKEYLGEDKTGETGTLDEEYQLAVAKADGDEELIGKLDVAFETAKFGILNATTSTIVKLQYNAALKEFENIVGPYHKADTNNAK